MPRALVFAFLLGAYTAASQSNVMAQAGANPPSRSQAASLPPEQSLLLRRLSSLAASSRDADLNEVKQLLCDRQTLDQLDDPKSRDRSRPNDLHVREVIEDLELNRSPVAAKTLASLAESGAFVSSWQRQALLVFAFAQQHPLLPQSLAFLDAQARPDSVNLHLAISALADNRSAESLALFGKKLEYPEFDTAFKLGWIRDCVLRHRRDPEMLRLVQNLLEQPKLDHECRTAIVQVLYDYKPEDWYHGAEGIPKPPDENATSPVVINILKTLGESLLHSDYSPEVKQHIKQTLTKLSRD
jgi:hypothetical protein